MRNRQNSETCSAPLSRLSVPAVVALLHYPPICAMATKRRMMPTKMPRAMRIWRVTRRFMSGWECRFSGRERIGTMRAAHASENTIRASSSSADVKIGQTDRLCQHLRPRRRTPLDKFGGPAITDDGRTSSLCSPLRSPSGEPVSRSSRVRTQDRGSGDLLSGLRLRPSPLHSARSRTRRSSPRGAPQRKPLESGRPVLAEEAIEGPPGLRTFHGASQFPAGFRGRSPDRVQGDCTR